MSALGAGGGVFFSIFGGTRISLLHNVRYVEGNRYAKTSSIRSAASIQYYCFASAAVAVDASRVWTFVVGAELAVQS